VECYGFQGYTHEYITRGDRAGGGISMYVNERWNYKVREDLNHCSDDIEMLWLELDKDSTRSNTNIVAGLIYRRLGSDPVEFNTKLNNILTLISQEK
jgi:hypothetical protein